MTINLPSKIGAPDESGLEQESMQLRCNPRLLEQKHYLIFIVHLVYKARVSKISPLSVASVIERGLLADNAPRRAGCASRPCIFMTKPCRLESVVEVLPGLCERWPRQSHPLKKSLQWSMSNISRGPLGIWGWTAVSALNAISCCLNNWGVK